MQNRIKIYVLFIVCSALLPIRLFGTHNRAGEITYRHISGYTYEITVTTYTYTKSQANRDRLTVNWGDGTSEEVMITSRTLLPNDYFYNTYVTQHTFPGSGVYQILMEDPNRNDGIKNIPNSVNTVFSIQTNMLISPFTGTNSTPVLLNPPIDKAAKNHIFIHNPAAYDPDGDSISYELTPCTADGGRAIDGYIVPPASDTVFINQTIGDLTWITPIDTGAYNIALHVDEWRNGMRIGRISRDMQINVYETDNNPPVNGPLVNYCVESGDTIKIDVSATDADNDPIKLYMVGKPISDETATFSVTESGQGYSKGILSWATTCDDARQQPYTFVFKSQDVSNDISLVDITSFSIRVIHSSPENLVALPGTDSIRLQWSPSRCGVPAGYKIYRKIGSYNFVHDSCEFGVPAYTGYELLDNVQGQFHNYYTDDNLGDGLVPGFDYCYMVTAYYADQAESFASEEVCTTLVPGTPPILQVSVLSDNETTGSILVSWAVPRYADTLGTGPFRYEIYRQKPGETGLTLVSTIPTSDFKDTTFTDQNINTLIFPYVYDVKLVYQDALGKWTELPGSETASSLYLNMVGSDNTVTLQINKRAPWLNYEFDVFRKNEETQQFDSIATVYQPEYSDEGLKNGVPYTYRARSLGKRPIYNSDYFVKNISHINIAEAVDTLPPCAPLLKAVSICDSAYNELTWTSPESVCGDDDIILYQIYYKPSADDDFQLIATQLPPDTTYTHNDNLESLAAIYGISAVDSFNNVSPINVYTIDSCLMFSLPNVFSPGNDGINDLYKSWNLGGFIKHVDMKIYNRFGQLIFETQDPYIKWDGYNQASKKLVPTGVYYYICDVFEPRLTGEKHYSLKGFIHVFSGEKNTQAGSE